MIKKNIALILLFLFLQQYQPCGNGCLRCSAEDKCEICDTSNAFFLKEDKCFHSPIENCQTYNLEGKCLQCKESYFQTDQNKCEVVEGPQEVPNCHYYTFNGNCVVCQNDTFLSNGKCLSVELVIDFCQVYDSKSTCTECQQNYLLSLDNKKCVEVNQVDECISYSLNRCVQCNDNSIIDYSYDKEILSTRAQELTMTNQQYVYEYFNNKWRYYHEFCVVTKVSNCEKFTDYKTCEACKKGFFLQNNNCKPNPINFINKCEKYTKLTECMQCVQGYYLKSAIECAKVEPVDNCSQYKQSANSSQCQLCVDGFYLQSLNKCIARTKTIDSCQTYSVELDTCSVCTNGFKVTNDGLKCLNQIEFCSTYSTSSESSNNHSCTLCQDGYYLNNNSCNLGTKEFCLRYNTNSDVCQLCINKYYLLNGECKAHDDISNCNIYSSTQAGICSQCVNGTALFTKFTNCKPVTIIDGCDLYSTATTCQKCKLGHNRVSDSQCDLLEADSKCQYKELGQCTICKDGYYLSNNNCLSPIQIAQKYCESATLAANGDYPCSVCQQYSLPYNYTQQQVCVSNESFTELKGTYTPVTNCLSYQYQGTNSLKCIRCEKGFFLDDQNDACVNTCNTTILRFKTDIAQTIQITYYNVCNTTYNDATCAVKVMQNDVNNANNLLIKCIKCATGYYDVVDFTETNVDVFYEDVTGSASDQDIYSLPERQCILKTGTVQQPLESNGVDPLEHCEMYQLFGSKTEYGCLKCKHQYNGLVKNWGVDNCMIFDDTNKVCQQCTNQYKLADGYTCTLLQVIDNCYWYKPNTDGVCEICDVGYYRSADNVCSPINPVVDNCKNYFIDQNKCAECNTGYIHSNNKNFCIEKKSRCTQYADVNVAEDPVICISCETGYYPANGGSSCVKGNVDYCWNYNQAMTNKCQSYLNYMKFTNTKKCQAVNKIDGCQTYSTKDVCDTCDPSTHYKSGDICCKYRQVNVNGQCKDIKINNCKTSDGGIDKCTLCLEKYNHDNYEGELDPEYKCCGDNTFYHPNTQLCTSLIDVSLSDINCLVWNHDTFQCMACKQDMYASDATGYCCPEQQYHVITDDKHTCVSIESVSSNCVQYDGDNSVCTKCNTDYVLSNGICCHSTSQYEDGGICKSNLTGCKQMNGLGTECTTCHDDYFLTDQVGEPKICCKYKNLDGATPEWFETGTTCNTTAFSTPITNCIKFRHNTDATLRFCDECESGYQVSENGKRCCPVNFTYNGTLCVKTEHISNQCKTLDTTDINKCTDCYTGYYLFKGQCCQSGKYYDIDNFAYTTITIENCNELNDDLTCKTCADNYTLTNNTCIMDGGITTGSTVVAYSDYYSNCALIDFANEKCVKCLGLSYQESGSNVCCEYGKKAVNNECVNITIANCNKEEGGVCTMYSASSIANCNSSSNGTSCDECDLGYVLVDGTCTKLDDLQQYCRSSEISDDCIAVDKTTCTCTSCRDHAYGDHCCPYGQRWNSNYSKCVYNDHLCAKQTEDNKCDECFFDPEYELTAQQFQYKYIPHANTVEVTEDITTNALLKYVYISNETADKKKCCKQGTYYDATNDGCNTINISHCNESNDGTTCTECEMEYKLVNNDANCCLYNEKWDDGTSACVNDATITACLTGYYSTNGHCCPDNFYYNLDSKKCEVLYDEKCKKSTSKYTCTECETNYELFDIPYRVQLEITYRADLQSIKDSFNIKRCLLTTSLANTKKINEVKSLIKNCQVENFASSQCTTCKTGYYKDSKDYCCQEGYVHDSTQNVCIQISELQTNCKGYNPTTKACYSCDDNFNLSRGRCCATGTFIPMFRSVFNNTCDLNIPNCMKVDEDIDECEYCRDGYVKSKGKCVLETEYWNVEDAAPKTITDTYDKCEVLNDLNDCIEPNLQSYVLKGRSCNFNQYYDGSNCQAMSQLSSELSDCKMIDSKGDCVQCNTKQLTNGRCCDYGYYWEPFTRQCQSIYKYQFCEEASYDKSGPCTKCMTGYYISQYQICAQEGKVVVDLLGTQQDISIARCSQADDTVSCKKCDSQEIVFDNTCTEYDLINAEQRIGECRIIKSGSPPTCIECEDNHYLTNNDKACCSEGSYWNGSECKSLSNVSLNCGQYENSKCDKCMIVDNKQTYLSNDSACCQEGEYAVNATTCAPISNITNCLKTDNHTVCNKCNSGFKLVGGQCVTNDIANCDIGANASECLICNNDYYLDTNDNTCKQQTAFNNCVTKSSNVDSCEVCDNGYYFDGKQCCEVTKYYRVFGTNNPVCASLVDTTITDCKEMENGMCVGCGTGKYLSEGNCCNNGTFWNGTTCQTPTGNGLEECNYFESLTKCKQIIVNNSDNSCSNNYYYHDGHCCPHEQHWNGTDCTLNSTVTKYNNCKTVSAGECVECNTGSNHSFGLCCVNGEYNKYGTCTTIPVTQCEIYDHNKCLQCNGVNLLTSQNKCCTGQNYDKDTDTCVNITETDQLDYDIYEKKILTCSTGNYLANTDHCCADNEFYDSGTSDCAAIPPAGTNCKRTKLGVDQNTDATCLVCDDGFIHYYGEQCYTSAGTDSVTKLAGTTTVVAKDNVLTNCSQMNNDGHCIACNANFNFTNQQCCADGSVAGTDNTCTTYAAGGNGVTLIADCLQGDLTTCSKCNTGFFLVQDNSLCCADGNFPTAANNCGAAGGVTDCIVYADFVEAKKCSTCAANTTLYVNPDNANDTLCCGYKDVNGTMVTMIPDFVNSKCIVYAAEITKCNNFNTMTNQCLECSTDNYMSNNNVCCDNGNYYQDQDQSTCLTTTLTNCDQETAQCDLCETGYYFNVNACCQDGQHQNAGCQANTAVPQLVGCKQANGVFSDFDCAVCDDGKIRSPYITGVTTKYLCCDEGQHADPTTPSCVANTIDKCINEVTDALGTSYDCKECDTDYQVVKDEQAVGSDVCCKENEFAVRSGVGAVTCSSKQKVNSDCTEWDRKKMVCTGCTTGTYLSGGRCCSPGDYSAADKDSCVAIGALVANCNKYNTVDGCTECTGNHLIVRTKSKIAADACFLASDANGFLQCDTYTDSLDKCLSCKTGHYLHKDKCVADNKQRTADDLNFEDIPAALNCKQVKVDPTNNTLNLCAVCIDNNYLVNDNKQCCAKGEYYDSVTSTCKTDGTVEFCEEYEDDQNKCTKCNDKYLLAILKNNVHKCMNYGQDNNELCLQTNVFEQSGENKFECQMCMDQGTEYVIEDDTSDRIVPYNSLPNCEHYDTQTVMSNSSLKCLQCYKNELNYLDTTNNDLCTVRTQLNNCTEFDITSDNCTACQEGYHLVTTGAVTNCVQNTGNCKIYNTGTSKCDVCNDDYQISFSGTAITCVEKTLFTQTNAQNPTFFPGYIDKCELQEECSTKYVTGIDSFLSKLFSCHMCTNNDLIPFVSFKLDTTFAGLQRYKRPNDNLTRQDTDFEMKSSQCLRPVGDSFNIAQQNFNFPSNCSLGMINSSLVASAGESGLENPNINNLGVFCVACKPGFQALQSNQYNTVRHVHKCQSISNCAVKGDNFNQCEKCQTNYVFLWENSMIKRDQCVEYSGDEYCLAYNNTTSECEYCMEGYSFNYDGKCEMIKGPNSSQLDLVKTFPDKSHYYEIKRRYRQGFGSTVCDNNYISIVNQQYNKICTYSPFVEMNQIGTSDNYKSNCVKYSADDLTLKCVECDIDSVLDEFGKCLLINDDIRHCQLAQNTQKCKQCKTGYVLIQDKCVLTDIDHCVSYIENSQSNSIKCAQCDTNYGLQNNVCIKDLFNSCLKIDDEDQCISCQSGYQLTDLKNNKKICINVNTHQNCGNYVSSDFQSFNIRCNTCKSNEYFLESLTASVQVCNQYSVIKHCQSYDISTTFNNSTLDCTACKDGYFLSNNQCYLRTIQIPQCKTYESTSQLCSICETDYFLSDDQKQCIATPRGISNCRIYEQQLLCRECESHYYLLEGDCVAVENSKIVQFCYTYSDSQSCTQCYPNYLLENEKCTPVVASNCLEITSATSCKTCNFGYQLKENEQGVVNCDLIEKPTISKCKKISDSIPFNCLVCDTDYYPDGDKCVKVEQLISNCSQYQSPFICEQCDNYHILSEDKTMCKPFYNQNCVLFEEQKESFCVICNSGYSLVDGECKKNGDFKDNCLLHTDNSVDGVSSTKCAMCKPGNTMNASGECKQTIVDSSGGDSDSGDSGEDTSNRSILATISIVFKIAMFLNYF